ncbi:MAG: hypothetical protein IT239_00685 [Bacteroidia bacterium]|nr:hypothetical protein [Bacteroidia bacterium]
MIKYLWLPVFFFLSSLAIAQEHVSNELYINPTRLINPAQLQSKNTSTNSLSPSGLWKAYIFEMDTLSLPIKDDFSRNSLTVYDTAHYPLNYKRSQIAKSFTVNGNVIDSIACRLTKT